MPGLFDPFRADSIQLPNRIVMGALTRELAGRTHVPKVLMAEHCARRASTGLIVTKANMIAMDGSREAAESEIHPKASYGRGAAGYTDYPTPS